MAEQSFWLSGKTLAVCAVLAGAGYLVLRDHTDHIVQFLPFAIFLLCPLMHVFMHAGHGGHGDRHEDHDRSAGETPAEAYRRGLAKGPHRRD